MHELTKGAVRRHRRLEVAAEHEKLAKQAFERDDGRGVLVDPVAVLLDRKAMAPAGGVQRDHAVQVQPLGVHRDAVQLHGRVAALRRREAFAEAARKLARLLFEAFFAQEQGVDV